MARKSRKAVNQVILPAAPSEKIYRAGLYARISVETERKREADTIGNQIQLLKDFSSENLDIDVVDIYVDAAVIIGLKTLRLKKCQKHAAF